GVLGGADLAVVERACDRVASGELDDPGDVPARLHGDLWTGNVLWTGSGDNAHAVLIDPAAHGGHRETDLAMLALFGAPHPDEILRGYDEAHPLREGWRDRVPLHQLHPLATHSAGHGAGYAIALADAARQVLRL
ncbi:phosphotransferase, partial [Dietzia sp. DQ11-71]